MAPVGPAPIRGVGPLTPGFGIEADGESELFVASSNSKRKAAMGLTPQMTAMGSDPEEVDRLRDDVRNAAHEYEVARRELGQVLRNRRHLKSQLAQQKAADTAARAATNRVFEEYRRWLQDDLLPVVGLQLTEEELDEKELAKRASDQSRQIEAFASRCSGLRRCLERQSHAVICAGQKDEFGFIWPPVELDATAQRLDEIGELQRAIQEEQDLHKAEVSALREEIAKLEAEPS
mmetsp:Transcript_36012/g.84435  ORF Transcript_36012/g.84435 Transcript_36012/m.84435 type:complete len:234 (-) Transcript_36012:265-966(-)